MSTCFVAECSGRVLARGMCNSHYQKWRRHGDPLHGRPTWKSSEERFWSKVKIGEPDECWPWTGSRNNKGYGWFSVRHVLVLAHRFSYKIRYGDLPEGTIVLHSCDNPPCVNPAHLRAGSYSENTTEMYVRGRGRPGTRSRLGA